MNSLFCQRFHGAADESIAAGEEKSAGRSIVLVLGVLLLRI